MAGRDDLDRALDDGRGPDDDDRDELDDDELDDDGDEAGAGDGAADWKPPTKEEWEAAQAKLKRARDQAKRLREASGGRDGDRSRRPAARAGARQGDRQAARTGAQRQAGGRDDVDDELDRREREAESREREERWEMRAVRGDARAALLARGAATDLVDLAIAKIKPSDIEYDDDDEPILDDWLDRMEERYPRLFRRRQAGTGAAGGGAREQGDRPAAGGRRAGSLDQGAGSSRAAGDTGGGRRADESHGAYVMRMGREADGLQQRGRRR